MEEVPVEVKIECPDTDDTWPQAEEWGGQPTGSPTRVSSETGSPSGYSQEPKAVNNDCAALGSDDEHSDHNFKSREPIFVAVKAEVDEEEFSSAESEGQQNLPSEDLQTTENAFPISETKDDDSDCDEACPQPVFVAVKEEPVEETEEERINENDCYHSSYAQEEAGAQYSGMPFNFSVEAQGAGPSSTRAKGPKVRRKKQKKIYVCSVCGKEYRDSYELKLHMRFHLNERPHCCTICGREYITKGALRQHLLSHAGVKPHRCEQCGASFTQKSDLRVHFRVHTKETPFACMYCERRFGNVSNLNQHVRTHTGSRPFECALCSKAFSHKGHLIRHMRIHTGERPYKCSECGKEFADKTTMKRHDRMHLRAKQPKQPKQDLRPAQQPDYLFLLNPSCSLLGLPPQENRCDSVGRTADLTLLPGVNPQLTDEHSLLWPRPNEECELSEENVSDSPNPDSSDNPEPSEEHTHSLQPFSEILGLSKECELPQENISDSPGPNQECTPLQQHSSDNREPPNEHTHPLPLLDETPGPSRERDLPKKQHSDSPHPNEEEPPSVHHEYILLQQHSDVHEECTHLWKHPLKTHQSAGHPAK